MRPQFPLLAACFSLILPAVYAHWCGIVEAQPLQVFSLGTLVATLSVGTDVTYEDALTRDETMTDGGCYVTLMLPVGGLARIHSGPCHHPFLHQYPGYPDIDASPAPAPMPSMQAAPARKLLQEGDGDVEDDTWYIKTVQRCKP